MAVQEIVPGPYPLIVKLAGVLSDAVALGGLMIAPLPGQESDTVTPIGLLSEKSFTTWKVATALFTIVQEPVVTVAEQLPVE